MNNSKRYILKPLYIGLFIAACIGTLVSIVGIVITAISASDIADFWYTLMTTYGPTMVVSGHLYLTAYFIKWEFVYSHRLPKE